MPRIKRANRHTISQPPKKSLQQPPPVIDKSAKVEIEEVDLSKIPDCLICPLCKDMFLTPLLYLCGHTFCRSCVNSLPEESQLKCPLCRSSSEELIINYTVTAIMEHEYPKEYEYRTKEHERRIAMLQKLDTWMVSSRYIFIRTFIEKHIQNRPINSIARIIRLLTRRGFIKEEICYSIAKFISTEYFKKHYGQYGNQIINLRYANPDHKLRRWLLQKPGSKKRASKALLLLILWKDFETDKYGFINFANENKFKLGTLDSGILKSLQELPTWIVDTKIDSLPDIFYTDEYKQEREEFARLILRIGNGNNAIIVN